MIYYFKVIHRENRKSRIYLNLLKGDEKIDRQNRFNGNPSK